MNVLRHARVVATLLLGLQTFALARASVPSGAAAICHCHHVPGTPCDCPMMRTVQGEASSPRSSDAPCWRAEGCATPDMAFTLLPWLGLPEPEAAPHVRPSVTRVDAVFVAPQPPLLRRPRPRPKSKV